MRPLSEHPEIVAHDVVTRAMRRTGRDTFDGAAWIAPLERLTRSLDREARLRSVGRRRTRDELVGLLAGRVGPDPDPAVPVADLAAGSTVIVVTGADPVAVAALGAALGSGPDGPATGGRDAADRFASAFASLRFEEGWHVPAYAEWLADDPLDDVVADVVADAVAQAGERAGAGGAAGHEGAAPIVLAATELAERLATVVALVPHARVVVVTGDLDAVAAATTERSTTARRRHDPGADPDRIARYWAWRVAEIERRRAESGVDATVTVDRARVLADAAAVAAHVRAALPGQA